jgi:monoterpene epsilon-lactone hydrolase
MGNQSMQFNYPMMASEHPTIGPGPMRAFRPMALGQWLAAAALTCIALCEAAQAAPPMLQADGSVHMPETDYPMPGSFTPAARKAFTEYFARGGDPAFTGDIANVHRIYDDEWAGPILKRWEALYPVTTERTSIAGVPVDIVTPATGVVAAKKHKVLINFHGGGFILGGGGIGGRMEAVPLAGIGGYKVVTVDYREAPEAHYPAATDDAEKVYVELLKSYAPQNIGVYGSSAGGILTAQLVARLQRSKLPLPGAIAIMAAGATKQGASDSSHWILGLTGATVNLSSSPPPTLPSYFSRTDFDDPLAAPAESPEILARFPPTLVLSSSRDALLGSALDTYAKLRAVRVESELYVRHGFGHGYFTQAPELPEAIAAWQETVWHFDRYLGTTKRR